MITLVRLRFCQRTRDYATRRTADGKSKKEIIRCLKRTPEFLTRIWPRAQTSVVAVWLTTATGCSITRAVAVVSAIRAARV
jgi:hypothetical protein